MERGTSVLGLLNRLEDERQQRGEIPPGSDEELGSDEQPAADNLRRQVAELLVLRASGHLSDPQRRYPQWELPNHELQRLLQDGVGGVILLGAAPWSCSNALSSCRGGVTNGHFLRRR